MPKIDGLIVNGTDEEVINFSGEVIITKDEITIKDSTVKRKKKEEPKEGVSE